MSPDADKRDDYSIAQEQSRRFGHMLALVRSVVVRSAETGSPEVQNFAAHLEGRIAALSRTQMLLNPDDGLDLQDLIREELLAVAARENETFTIGGPDVVVSFLVAEALGLAFHELATNAVKFGALGEAEGKLEISWRIQDGQVELCWRERGVQDAQRGADGFGLDIIERQTPYQIGGETDLQFTPDGVVCVMRFPFEPQGSQT